MNPFSRKIHLLESILNVASGFAVSTCIYLFVLPLMGWHFNLGQSIGLTALFTVTSVLRSYLWRRFFAQKGKQWLSQNTTW